jgi:hypothetical protein
LPDDGIKHFIFAVLIKQELSSNNLKVVLKKNEKEKRTLFGVR